MNYRVAFIGLGTLGFPICCNLAQSGVDIIAFDARPKPERLQALRDAGARIASSLAEVSEGRNVIVTLLPDSAAVESVLLNRETLEHLNQGTICVDMTAGYPPTTLRLGKILAERGATMADAPICNGGVRGAYERRLTLCVGADITVFEQLRPMLSLIAKELVHVGPLGAGQATKLVDNSMSLGFFSVVAEATALGVAYGIDQEKLISTLLKCAAAGFMLESASKNLFELPTGDVNFQLYLATKDLRCATTLAGELGVPHLVSDAVHSFFEVAERTLGPNVESRTAPWTLLKKFGARRQHE